MVKRLVFDVDDTLLMWKKEYLIALKKALEYIDYNYDDFLVENINKIIDSYEQYYNIYDKYNLLNLINLKLNLTLPDIFIDKFLDEIGDCAEDADKEVIETLQYLYNKYELVVLTNWFTEAQTRRLEKSGILNFFKNIYGGDKGILKPYAQSYSRATTGLKPSDCVMIGDNIVNDVQGALDFGMKAILCSFKNNEPTDFKYVTIQKFRELKNIL